MLLVGAIPCAPAFAHTLNWSLLINRGRQGGNTLVTFVLAAVLGVKSVIHACTVIYGGRDLQSGRDAGRVLAITGPVSGTGKTSLTLALPLVHGGELGRAVVQARLAVLAEPDNARFLDTLTQVQARAGDCEAAGVIRAIDLASVDAGKQPEHRQKLLRIRVRLGQP